MEKVRGLAACAAVLLCLNACAARENATTVSAKPDNSRSSLDWDGIYTGTLPCADCEGLQTVIRIKKDSSYVVQAKYLGKSDEAFESKGMFDWSEDGGKILLKNVDERTGPSMYLVGENLLIQLDSNGNRIPGELADRYVLRKVDPGITEKYWKLLELYGQPLARSGKFTKEPHIILKIEDSRIIGHGGCNSFSGGYDLVGFNRIAFSNIVSTQMACEHMRMETQLLKALGTADNYVIKGDTLTLNRARMVPLARFEVVYLR